MLIVDDDKDILTFLRHNCKEVYRVFTATDGEEAIAQVKRFNHHSFYWM